MTSVSITKQCTDFNNLYLFINVYHFKKQKKTIRYEQSFAFMMNCNS